MNIKKLQTNLEELTGLDLIEAEKKARTLGANTVEVNYSKIYQAVIAAKVLGITYDDLILYKAKEFAGITAVVSNFLLSGFVETTLAEK